MDKNKVKEQYFEWLCSKVNCSAKYSKLMSFLYDKEFVYTISLDENRAEDGINLRYEFGREMNISSEIIFSSISDCPCKILEMMVALSMRCEEHIMSNSEFGDRTGNWFWGMIKNLGLHTMTDKCFNVQKAENIIKRLITHDYAPNGEGGLFTVDCGHDLRKTEIWYQMCWYLDTVL